MLPLFKPPKTSIHCMYCISVPACACNLGYPPVAAAKSQQLNQRKRVHTLHESVAMVCPFAWVQSHHLGAGIYDLQTCPVEGFATFSSPLIVSELFCWLHRPLTTNVGNPLSVLCPHALLTV